MRVSLLEELEPILKHEFPGIKTWRSFAQWWLFAHGLDYRGKEKDYCVDGSGDGGLDLIAWPLPSFSDKCIRIIQSKFYKNPPKLNNLKRFMEAIEAIKGGRDQFDLWLDTVSDDLRTTYEKLRDEHSAGKLKFILITTAKLDTDTTKFLLRKDIEVYEGKNIRQLLKFYNKGQTPRIEKLTFTPTSKVMLITETDKVKMYVFSVHLKDFAQAFKKYDKLLFAGNIRYGLKGQIAKQVKDGISDTLSKHDEEFVFSHNGINMVTQRLTKKGKNVTLFSPSVVNGAQTITYIGQKWLKKIDKTKAEVLVKIVEVLPQVSFEELETDIAIRSNTQIKVDFSDLIVSEPSLVTLQKHLLLKRIYLERKKGDKPPLSISLRITKERLVQILACLNKELGPTAPKRLQELFKKHNAVDLIRKYVNENKVNEVAALIWLYDLTRRTINGYGNRTSKRRGQIASYAIFAATATALKKVAVWQSLVKQLSMQEDYSGFERNGSVKMLIKSCRGHMLKYSKNASGNESAFYKNKEETNEAVRKVVKKITRFARSIS